MELPLIKTLVFIFVFLIGYYSYTKKAVDFSGLVSSLLVGIIILFSLPLAMWIMPMLALFVTGSVSSKYKWSYKVKMGVAENAKGRSFKNVIGNGGVAAVAAIIYYLNNDKIFLYAYLASIASATADTVATEIGQLSRKRPRLLPWLKEVPTGTTGAVSALGEAMALVAATGIALIPFAYFGIFMNFWDWNFFLITIAAGFLGCQIDSLLGSLTEPKNEEEKGFLRGRIFNNQTTNFLSAAAAAIIAAALYLYL